MRPLSLTYRPLRCPNCFHIPSSSSVLFVAQITMNQQLHRQQDDVQLQSLSMAFTPHSYDRVASQDHALADHEDILNRPGIPALIAGDLPEKHFTSAISRPESRSSSLKRQLGEKRRRQKIISTWWLEISACFVSIAALLALVAVLLCYKNKPSPDWPKWLSLNTIVAIFITLLKTAVLLIVAEGLGQLKWSWFAIGTAKPLDDLVKYDDASRGPVGSMKLLWRLRFSHILSSLAALITILAVATEPFAQQLLHVYDCPVDVPGITELPRTNYFFQDGGIHIGADKQSIIPEVQSAINTGLFSPSLVPPFNCATGNCTWDSKYSTVGWCSQCEDVSNQVTITNTTYDATPGPNSIRGNLTSSLSRYISTNNPLLGPTNQNNGAYAAVGTEQMAVMGGTPGSDLNSLSVDFLLGLTNFETLNPSTMQPWSDCNTTVANQTLWKCRGYGAARCSLKPCVKTFNATIKAGKLTETLLDTSTNWGPLMSDYYTYFMLDTQCINPVEREMLIQGGYNIDPTQRWIGYNMTFEWVRLGESVVLINNSFPESMARRGCIYGQDQLFEVSFTSWFWDNFSGKITGPAPDLSLPLGSFQGSQQLLTIYDYGKVSFESVAQSFENISVSLTNYIRQNGNSNYSAPAVGHVVQYKTCVAVRWAWLTYPATLVALTVCFFVLMVKQTWPSEDSEGENSPGIFKSNPLPLLYYGLWHSEWNVHERYGNTADTADLKSMEELANNTTVKFNSSPYRNVARLEVQEVRDQ